MSQVTCPRCDVPVPRGLERDAHGFISLPSSAKTLLPQQVGNHPVSPALQAISQADGACPSFQQFHFSPCSQGSSYIHLMGLAMIMVRGYKLSATSGGIPGIAYLPGSSTWHGAEGRNMERDEHGTSTQ